MCPAPPPCGRLLRRDAHRQVQTFGARCGGCEGPCRLRGPAVGGPVVSGTFVLPSPPATSPALGTGECWLRRRDSRPHVPQYAGAQDLTPPPAIAPAPGPPCEGGHRHPWPRMPANRHDAQPALANVDHGLLGGPVPRLLPRMSRSGGRDLFMSPAQNLRCFRPRVLFIFLILQL